MKPSNPRRPGSRHLSPPSENDCDNIKFRIDLMGVRVENSKKVRAGDVLQVRLVRDGDMRAVVCQTDLGDPIGAVSAFPGLAQLIDCLEKGVEYSASVERSSAQSCSVFVARSV
jgi:hypothetical protein